MAKWLDKYEQGGLVLKQKTKDNYGKKPNPNDVKVSSGPGYVGMGNDIIGRDYSPAWGGQFEYGGNVAQKGKSIPAPTSADSLALYNNSMDLLKYYGNQKKYAPMGHENVLPGLSEYITSSNMEAMRQLASRVNRKSYPTTSRSSSIVNPDDEDFTMQDYYGRFVNEPYKYKQREQNNYILDLDSPFTLYDTRITPTKKYAFENIKKGNVWRANPLYGDRVTFYGYDPLSVKPYSMRTPQEKIEWEKKYGKNTPTPPPPPIPVITKETAKPKSTPTKKSKTEPVKQSSKKEPIITNDPKDPRLKAYNDSLKLSQTFPRWDDWADLNNSLVRLNGKAPTIVNTKEGLRGVKKPVQPIEYKKLEETKSKETKSTQPTPKGSKKYIVNGVEVSEEDFLGSGATTGGGKRVIYNTPKQGTQKVLRLDGTPETDPEKIRKALATANKNDNMAMGGSLPGAVGFTYARVAGSAPANGKYTKKTKASAQNGKEMQFYQDGLDWKPNSIAQDGNTTPSGKEFIDKWIQSPMYDQMLKTSSKNEKEYKTIKQGREENFSKPVVVHPSGNVFMNGAIGRLQEYRPEFKFTNEEAENAKRGGLKEMQDFIMKAYAPKITGYEVFVDKNLDQNDSMYQQVMAHEYGHREDAPWNFKDWNQEDYKQYTKGNKTLNYTPQADADRVKSALNFDPSVSEEYKKYLHADTGNIGEIRGILNEARYLGKANNIYDPYTEKITPEAFDKISNLKSGEASPVERLMKIFGSKEKAIELLNSVSKNKDRQPQTTAQDGGAIVDPMGQWAHPGEVTIIPATDITMEGVDYPVLGISDTGDTQYMEPGEDYQFDGEYVTEYPMMKKGGWLNKYK